MSNIVDDETGMQVGVVRDGSGNTALQSFGPSGCIGIEDQNDYIFALFNPNTGTSLLRTGDTLSGTMDIESVSGEVYFSDGQFKKYSLTQPSNRSLDSFYQRRSIVGNFNEIALQFNDLPPFRAGSVSGALFTGNPRTYDVVFSTNLPDTNYAISVLSENRRTWSFENKTVSGFTINANAAQALVSFVDWQVQGFV